MGHLQTALIIGALMAAAQPTVLAAQEPSQELAMISHQAADGEPGAELLYGLAYLEGRYHLTPDLQKAVHWLRRAARAGQPYAQMVLGNLFAEGKGVEKSPADAVYWWRMAARAGIPRAQYKMGKARLEGFGVEKNASHAVQWLTKAGANGDHDADFLLGKMYYEGYAVAQDVELARDWLSNAASHGHSDAINLLAAIDKATRYTTMVHEQSADSLKEKAAEGDPRAQYELALRYESGAWDVVKNPKKALYWLTKAASNGNHEAMATLAHVYARGELGITPDAEKAKYWAQRAPLKR